MTNVACNTQVDGDAFLVGVQIHNAKWRRTCSLDAQAGQDSTGDQIKPGYSSNKTPSLL